MMKSIILSLESKFNFEFQKVTHFGIETMIHKLINPKQQSRWKLSAKKQRTAQTSSPQQNCYYCLMKKKFNVGNSSQAKCLEHSMQTKNEQSLTKNTQNIISLQQIREYILKIDEGITYYYQIQRESESLQSSLNPIWYEIKRLDQKLLRMLNQANSFSQIQALQNNAHLNGLSGAIDKQKSSALEISYQENASISEAIKQWVLHFHKILYRKTFQKGRPVNDQNFLIGEQNTDLGIFKESMQRKFMLFVANLNRAQGKLQDALQKLLFYMQRCQSAGIVQHQKIQEDIEYLQQDHHYQNMKASGTIQSDMSFMQGNQSIDQDESAVQRIIIAQCLSIQALLIQHQALTSFN